MAKIQARPVDWCYRCAGVADICHYCEDRGCRHCSTPGNRHKDQAGLSRCELAQSPSRAGWAASVLYVQVPAPRLWPWLGAR